MISLCLAANNLNCLENRLDHEPEMSRVLFLNGSSAHLTRLLLLALLPMSFVFPSFLWALAVLAIPIIIHLFNFRVTKRVFFSNTRLLKQIKQDTTQKRRLKQLLVLACRFLFLFFLVMAFAQPFLPAKEQFASGSKVIIYLDNSQSMSGKVAEKTRGIDDGMARVREIINVFPLESRFKFITNDFAPFSNSYKTKVEIEELLSQLRLSPAGRSFEEVRTRMAADNSSVDIFWISDFQQSTLGRLTSLDSVNQWHFIPIQHEKSISNVFVDSVFRDNPFAIGGEKNTLTAKLKNSGDSRRDDMVVKLIINETQAATTIVNVEPNGEVSTTFNLPFGLKKLNEAKLIVNDFPISFDNEFFFALNFADKINVVEVKPESSVSAIQAVFGNKELFSLQSFLTSNVNYQSIQQADLVVINQVNGLDGALQSTLREYQLRNGLILLIPSARPTISSYQFLTKSRLSQAPISEVQEISNLDFQNPFFDNIIEDRTDALTMPKGRRLIDWGADRSAILKLKDGQPFLSQIGNTILLAAPLEAEFTNFNDHALFVPVMYRLAAAGKRETAQLYYSLDTHFVAIRGDSLSTEGQLKMVGNQEVIPTQRRNGDQVLLELPKYLINPGFYHIVLKEDTLDLLGLNVSKKESVLKQISGEELIANLGGGRNLSLFRSGTSASFGNEIKERYLGVSLWKYALLLSLLFLMGEILLIRFLK
jgi:hypothetical protein